MSPSEPRESMNQDRVVSHLCCGSKERVGETIRGFAEGQEGLQGYMTVCRDTRG